jgi:hypothetical protein
MKAPTSRQVRKQVERRDKAIATRKQLAADRARVLGPDHPDTLIAQVRLLELLHVERLTGLGLTWEEEEQLAADCARVLGPDHPDTLSSWALMQSFRWSGSRREHLSMEAEKQLAADCARILGSDHPATCTLERSLYARWAESMPLAYDDPSWQ